VNHRHADRVRCPPRGLSAAAPRPPARIGTARRPADSGGRRSVPSQRPSGTERVRSPFFIGWLGALLLLVGCAGLRTVDSDVNSYSHWPAGRAPSSYAFERLPSQQAHPDEQDALEAAARDALAKAGFTEAADASKADALVQVSARTTRYDVLYDDPFYWRGGFWWHRGFGPWWGSGASLAYTTPRYVREVAVLIRDRASGAVLYETRASSEGYSGSDKDILAAMFEAALKDFPQAAVNPRRVSVPLAGTS